MHIFDICNCLLKTRTQIIHDTFLFLWLCGPYFCFWWQWTKVSLICRVVARGLQIKVNYLRTSRPCPFQSFILWMRRWNLTRDWKSKHSNSYQFYIFKNILGKGPANKWNEFLEKFQREAGVHFQSKNLCCRFWELKTGLLSMKLIIDSSSKKN